MARFWLPMMNRTIRTVLTQALTRAGCKVHATSSLTTLMRWVEEGRGDLVITDVMMPDGNGIEMIPKISQERPDLPVIVISAQNTIMTAIQANEVDAHDYLPKPFDLPDLLKRAGTAMKNRKLVAASAQVGAAPKPAPRGDMSSMEGLPLVGRTPVMQELYRLIARVMNSVMPVLITGESGTGKSLIAPHVARSVRPARAALSGSHGRGFPQPRHGASLGGARAFRVVVAG